MAKLEIYLIILDGQVPAQKNNKQIVMNRATGRPFITSSKIVKQWQELAAWQLKSAPKSPGKRVRVGYTFFVKDNRPRDIDNMIASVNDALVKNGTIEDDSWQWLEIGFARAEIDKSKPRVAIAVQEIDEKQTKQIVGSNPK